jgi:hypothetical protein
MKKTKWILIIIAVLFLILTLLKNKINNNYENLSKEDQYIINEYSDYCAMTKEKDIWSGYNLCDKTILAIANDSSSIYLINSKNEINSIFSEKIKLPEGNSLNNIYRISSIDPQTWHYKFDGNFNTIGREYHLFNNNVYYVKYNKKESIDAKYSSKHFIAFLSHEAFHYYIQNEWNDVNEPIIEDLNNDTLEIMKKEYEILNKIQKELATETSDKTNLLEDAKCYTSVINEMIKLNPNLMQSLLMKETVEGTATYIGIKASNIVNYDFGVMYFDNVKNVAFDDVFKQIDMGKIDNSFLINRAPYEVGSEISLLLDQLEVPNWQETLNTQTKDSPQTLYSILKNYVDNLN